MVDWVASDDLPAQADIPKGRQGAPKAGEQAPGGGTYAGVVSGQPRELPPEADTLYGRVRKAEGTAAGDGYVFYGGQSFKPSKDFPEWEGAQGPQGKTHAAGPGQWQPGTWNGLKPAFEERFGREPDFSSQDDQKAMTWLNGAKHYPGGEEKLKADLASGKLDESALTSEWRGFGRNQPWAVTQNGKWKVGDKALAYEQGRSNTSVVWMSPDDYLGMVPESADKDKRKSLLKSLNAGDEIESIPSLDATVKDGRLKIIDQDGRNRARVAKEEGVDLIPVAVHGATGNASWIEDMNGAVRPFDFTPVPKATPPAPPWYERFGTGAADVGYGAMQLGARAPVMGEGAAFMSPEMQAANDPGMITKAVDARVAERERGIEAERAARGETGTDWWRVAGNVAATAPLGFLPGPGEVAAGAGMAARIGGAVARGALAGGEGAALEPVTSGEYGPQKAGQVLEGMAVGAGLTGAPAAIGGAARAIGNTVSRIVSPKTITEAASRLFGENTKALTEDKIIAIKDRLGATFERIEKSHDIDISRDPKLVSELDLAKQEARTTLGDPNYGGRSGPILAAVDKFLSLADDNGVIPGKSAATLWHEGGAVDRLTKNADPSIRQFGQQLKTTARDAFSRVLPPDDAAVYSATRRQWRDMKIVEKAIPTGQHEVRPRQFVQRVRQRFPNEKEMRTPPEVVKLARAVGETWPMGDTSSLAARTAARTVRAIAAGGLGHLVGGPIGGGIGVAGELAMERLMRDRRIASRNAMLAFRPPAPARPPSNAMRVLRPFMEYTIRAPNAFAAPLGAAVAAP